MNSKKQSVILVGIGLIILGAVVLGFALSQPKIAVSSLEETVISSSVLTENEISSVQTTVMVQTENVTQSSNNNEINVSYPLNLNTCTAEELMTISGIGEVKASSIIQYRDYLGGYTSVEQIKNIKGIGDTTYEKISPYLTV